MPSYPPRPPSDCASTHSVGTDTDPKIYACYTVMMVNRPILDRYNEDDSGPAKVTDSKRTHMAAVNKPKHKTAPTGSISAAPAKRSLGVPKFPTPRPTPSPVTIGAGWKTTHAVLLKSTVPCAAPKPAYAKAEVEAGEQLLKNAWRAVGLYDSDEEDEPTSFTINSLPVSSSSSADMSPSQKPAGIINKCAAQSDAAESRYRQAALIGLFNKDTDSKRPRMEQQTIPVDTFKQGDFNAQAVAAHEMVKEKCKQWMTSWMGNAGRIASKKVSMQTNDFPPEKKKTVAPRRNPIDQAAPGVYQKKHPTNVTCKPKWTVVTDEDGFVQKLRSHSRFTIGQLGKTATELTDTTNIGTLTVAIAGDRNLQDKGAVELAKVLAMTQNELDQAHDIFMLISAKSDILAGNQGVEGWTDVLAMTQHELDQSHDIFMITVAKTDMLMEVQEPSADSLNMSFPTSIKTEVLTPVESEKIAVQETSLNKSTMMVDRQEVNPMQPPRKKTPAQKKLDKQMREKAASDKAMREAIMQEGRKAKVLARRRVR
jgi:hypothetical protein